MVRVLDRNNLVRALKQVQRNKEAAGIDGMAVDKLPDFLKQHWPKIRQQLAEGTYQPKPVLRVEIPKPDGRKRKLGIPTVLDRLIQQAIAQIIAELRKSLLGWVDFCSCKIKLSAIHGGQSVFRNCQNTESFA